MSLRTLLSIPSALPVRKFGMTQKRINCTSSSDLVSVGCLARLVVMTQALRESHPKNSNNNGIDTNTNSS